jgi:hypothetical protein
VSDSCEQGIASASATKITKQSEMNIRAMLARGAAESELALV